MTRLAERAPTRPGLKVTLSVQLAPGATPEKQLVEERAKSVPWSIFAAARLSVWLPVFDSVSACGADVVARTWFPKESDVGESTGTAPSGAVPVPDSATVCGDPEASSVNVRDAARAPAAVGVNVTVAV